MTNDHKDKPQVKRYDCTSGGSLHCYGCYTMTEDALGDYVLFEDYAAISAQLSEARRALASAKTVIDSKDKAYALIQQRWDAMAAKAATTDSERECNEKLTCEIDDLRRQLSEARQQSEAEAIAYSSLSAEHERLKAQLSEAQARLADMPDGRQLVTKVPTSGMLWLDFVDGKQMRDEAVRLLDSLGYSWITCGTTGWHQVSSAAELPPDVDPGQFDYVSTRAMGALRAAPVAPAAQAVAEIFPGTSEALNKLSVFHSEDQP